VNSLINYSNILHSSNTGEWGTPSWIMDIVRKVIDPIELDPCSRAQWNYTVKAERFLDEKYDSLVHPWTKVPVSIFINPPGGKLHNCSRAALFWNRLCEYAHSGLVKHAIWIGFSLEQLAVSQSYYPDLMVRYPICIVKKRIKFDRLPNVQGQTPSHSNFILYRPGIINRTDKFVKAFEGLGAIINEDYE